MNFTFSYAASCFQNIQDRYSTVVLRSVVWTSLRSIPHTFYLAPSQVIGLARRIYSCDMRHVHSQRRGRRVISCVRVEKWKKRGWEVVFFLRCAPNFSYWPIPSLSESRFNGSEDHNDVEGRDAPKVSWGSTGDDSQCPRTRKSRFMRAFFASKRISLTSPLCRLFGESSFLSGGREEEA